MTFVAWPAWSMPTDTTTACVGSVRLLTICCRATTAWHSAGTYRIITKTIAIPSKFGPFVLAVQELK